MHALERGWGTAAGRTSAGSRSLRAVRVPLLSMGSDGFVERIKRAAVLESRFETAARWARARNGTLGLAPASLAHCRDRHLHPTGLTRLYSDRSSPPPLCRPQTSARPPPGCSSCRWVHDAAVGAAPDSCNARDQSAGLSSLPCRPPLTRATWRPPSSCWDGSRCAPVTRGSAPGSGGARRRRRRVAEPPLRSALAFLLMACPIGVGTHFLCHSWS